MTRPLNVCVFCASSNGASAEYREVARYMGECLARRSWPLVYGGGSVGLMGEAARSVHAHGGQVIGVIPDRLRKLEVCYEGCDELIVTPDMAERKTIMIDRSDVFVCLPGSFGTMDELFEVLTLAILGYHSKPTLLVDVDGFYAPLVSYFERFRDDNLARPEYLEHYLLVPDVDAAIDWFERHASESE